MAVWGHSQMRGTGTRCSHNMVSLLNNCGSQASHSIEGTLYLPTLRAKALSARIYTYTKVHAYMHILLTHNALNIIMKCLASQPIWLDWHDIVYNKAALCDHLQFLQLWLKMMSDHNTSLTLTMWTTRCTVKSTRWGEELWLFIVPTWTIQESVDE